MKYIDMHCDTVTAMKPEDNLLDFEGHINLKKLKEGGCAVQNFAVFAPQDETDRLFETGASYVDRLDEQLSRYPELIEKVRNADDIDRVLSEGKTGALLTLEEGEQCEGSIEKLHYFYERGARMVALTWNFENSIGFPNLNLTRNTAGSINTRVPDTRQGLTSFGKDFICEMESLGMLVDVSHLSDAGFYDCADILKGPFVASHSDARSVCPHVRNLTDDMIRVLANKGGAAGLNFCMNFLDAGGCGGTIDAVVRHALHIVNKGGIGVLGLGTDFDGIETNTELYDATVMPRLYEALHAAGFSYDDADKIFFENAYRVYREVLS